MGHQSRHPPYGKHGTHNFYLRDPDDNWWEILANPESGYAWMFAKSGDIDNWGAGEKPGFNPQRFHHAALQVSDPRLSLRGPPRPVSS